MTNPSKIVVFEKKYDGESLYDLDRDIFEAVQAEYNPLMNQIPDNHIGLPSGTFVVSIVWESKEECEVCHEPLADGCACQDSYRSEHDSRDVER